MMNRRSLLASILAALLFALVAPAVCAQSTGSPVLYRIDSGSFSRGCYDPCDCPLYTTNDLRGTYTLALDTVGPLFTTYKVNNVNWVATINGQQTRITGSGDYK